MNVNEDREKLMDELIVLCYTRNELNMKRHVVSDRVRNIRSAIERRRQDTALKQMRLDRVTLDALYECDRKLSKLDSLVNLTADCVMDRQKKNKLSNSLASTLSGLREITRSLHHMEQTSSGKLNFPKKYQKMGMMQLREEYERAMAEKYANSSATKRYVAQTKPRLVELIKKLDVKVIRNSGGNIDRIRDSDKIIVNSTYEIAKRAANVLAEQALLGA